MNRYHGSPAAIAVIDADRAIVGGHNLGDDRQPQPGTTTTPGSVGVQPEEPLKNLVPCGGRDSRAVIDHLYDGVVTLGAHDDGHLAGGMAGRVIGQVAQQSHEPVRIDAGLDRRKIGDYPQGRFTFESSRLRSRQIIEIGLDTTQRQAAFIGARQ
ncbi:hypothetical protein A5642_09590 [Mycolicibacterium mucogenicum]|uniref:Uncharacterized protein n=1 Tax=Mycolicibacterium mucogenicum TaxID=56689 RepID=A0A1A0N3F8_MYCMU|nr:hypothetical protein A5642_09590 [Mycolicibacterium mucogenicum]